MKNTYKLVWSDEALKGLQGIITYLETNFSEKDVKRFVSKLEEQLAIITVNPRLYSFFSKSKQVRRAVVAKLTSIYYRIDGDNINIISIFDNRQNPDKSY